MICSICTHSSGSFATAQVLRKYQVHYFRCPECGFIQTEHPYWLEEAYSAPITASDVGMVARNITLARVSQVILTGMFDSNGRLLDYGGGYGLFVRLMRDAGFDAYWYDKFCSNILARGFAASINDGHEYELVTAFELFEHLSEPRRELERMLDLSRNVLFTTELLPDNCPSPEHWWYYGLQHGQHVSLYTRSSLLKLGQQFNLNLYTNGRNIHLLTEKRIPSQLFRLLSSYRISGALSFFLRKKGLTADDYARITGHSLDSSGPDLRL